METPQPVAHLVEIHTTTGCWLWVGKIDSAGYGRFYHKNFGRTYQLAHRVTYELAVGPIPNGLDLDHLCRVRRCVNPAHLEPVTRAENLRRSHAPNFLAHREMKCQHCGGELRPRGSSSKNYCPACDRSRQRTTRNRSNNA